MNDPVSGEGEMQMKAPIPILRMFDEERTKQFYTAFLGFHVDWEHRYEPGMPLYMQVSRGACVLHLSEHYGDCSPGGAVRIEIADAAVYQQELLAQDFKYARPGLEKSHGFREVRVQDPSGNRLMFYSK